MFTALIDAFITGIEMIFTLIGSAVSALSILLTSCLTSISCGGALLILFGFIFLLILL